MRATARQNTAKFLALFAHVHHDRAVFARPVIRHVFQLVVSDGDAETITKYFQLFDGQLLGGVRGVLAFG